MEHTFIEKVVLIGLTIGLPIFIGAYLLCIAIFREKRERREEERREKEQLAHLRQKARETHDDELKAIQTVPAVKIINKESCGPYYDYLDNTCMKYIVARLRTNDDYYSGRERDIFVVRADRTMNYHSDIKDYLMAEIADLPNGESVRVDCIGGGYLDFVFFARKVVLHGESEKYGQEPSRETTAKLIRESEFEYVDARGKTREINDALVKVL